MTTIKTLTAAALLAATVAAPAQAVVSDECRAFALMTGEFAALHHRGTDDDMMMLAMAYQLNSLGPMTEAERREHAGTLARVLTVIRGMETAGTTEDEFRQTVAMAFALMCESGR